MQFLWIQALVTLVLVGLSSQHQCDECDCIISADDGCKGVHLTTLTCMDGTVTWYNPTGALRIELKPERTGNFRSCFIVNTGDVKLKVSREVDLNINSKSPSQRNKFELNDHNLQTLVTFEGKSKEVCIQATDSVILYLEPEVDETLGYKKVVFQYDLTFIPKDEKSPIEECRPCSEEEILKAYCSSDFVIVGSMESVHHHDDIDKTKIDVEVAQIIRHTGSHFSRPRRDLALQGTILAPRKCGVSKGDGLFLMTGRVRLGELTMGCAPYLDEWEAIVSRAEQEGRMECARD
ncbi:meteorin-like protein [Mercenaria mercenaria]|uniref:meteorin-like protein n=1 Tax=Mercenaria mercenaria TaxID=6596 RepID=UPI00234ED2BC|nr:meteorin-like protein [Mercenaria mercenaria]